MMVPKRLLGSRVVVVFWLICWRMLNLVRCWSTPIWSCASMEYRKLSSSGSVMFRGKLSAKKMVSQVMKGCSLRPVEERRWLVGFAPLEVLVGRSLPV